MNLSHSFIYIFLKLTPTWEGSFLALQDFLKGKDRKFTTKEKL